MKSARRPRTNWILALSCLSLGAGCGSGASSPQPTPEAPQAPETAPTAPPPPVADPAAIPEELSRGLLIAYSQFQVENGSVTASPGPAHLEMLYRRGGQWRTEVIEDPGSNVFHKAMYFEPAHGAPGILTIGGTAAAVRLWRRGASGWSAETLWQEDFGGPFSRMRDAEIANLFGDGPAIAVGTHDQGVFATIRQGADGTFTTTQHDRTPNTFIHEIEVGDLDGNGALEVYATPSEPNDLDGGEQHGEVVRYQPQGGGQRTVVADLGNRHAKEIWVGDVDGDGRDELYVAVEALTTGTGDALQIVEPVEIRRYDADTAPSARVVIATLQDRLTRFLTVGDVDGDGRREMVAAGFRSGLWLLRPGRDPRGEWSAESIDRESSGFEHTSLLTDLDGDGRDELYVASDDQGELRRYVFVNGRPRRETIHRREIARSMITWNLTAFPVSILGSP